MLFFHHPDYLLHDTGPSHPERPDRLRAITSHLLECGLWNELEHRVPAPAAMDDVARAHPIEHVEELRRRCESGERILDEGDTVACRDSLRIALLAAGAVTGAVDAVLGGEAEAAFCAVRPPGHHAESVRAIGFCLLNNIAIGARHAQARHGVRRVAIVDFDVHHGNGTQEIFYSDPSVLYISTHQYPLFPGTGASEERGDGAGVGTTLNIPMRPGSGRSEYLAAFNDAIVPALDAFAPELIMISAGFDAHRDDPLANIRLVENDFAEISRLLRGAAKRHCGGRVVSVLEGGYNLHALAASVEAHLRALIG